MTCVECGAKLNEFDSLIQLHQIRLEGQGDTQTVGVQPTGYAHHWHFTPPGDRYHY